MSKELNNSDKMKLLSMAVGLAKFEVEQHENPSNMKALVNSSYNSLMEYVNGDYKLSDSPANKQENPDYSELTREEVEIKVFKSQLESHLFAISLHHENFGEAYYVLFDEKNPSKLMLNYIINHVEYMVRIPLNVKEYSPFRIAKKIIFTLDLANLVEYFSEQFASFDGHHYEVKFEINNGMDLCLKDIEYNELTKNLIFSFSGRKGQKHYNINELLELYWGGRKGIEKITHVVT